MDRFFPRQTIEWSKQELATLQRISLSLPLMACATGVVIRLMLLGVGHAGGWWAVLGRFVALPILLLALTTAHLGNYTIKSWLWRAPLFAVIEAASEAALLALFIAVGIARSGTQPMHFGEWPGLVGEIAALRMVLVLMFGLVLAAVVQLVRRELLKRDHRSSTAEKIHEEHLRHTHQPSP